MGRDFGQFDFQAGRRAAGHSLLRPGVIAASEKEPSSFVDHESVMVES